MIGITEKRSIWIISTTQNKEQPEYSSFTPFILHIPGDLYKEQVIVKKCFQLINKRTHDFNLFCSNKKKKGAITLKINKIESLQKDWATKESSENLIENQLLNKDIMYMANL